MSKTPLKILAFFIGIAAILLIFFGTSQIWYAQQSELWPNIQGKILASSVTSSVGKSSHGIVNVQYEYTIENRVYQGNRLAYSPTQNKYWADANLIQTKFYNNAEVKVYYAPNSPENAVLIPGSMHQLEEYSSIISGVFLLSFAILVFRLADNKEY